MLSKSERDAFHYKPSQCFKMWDFVYAALILEVNQTRHAVLFRVRPLYNTFQQIVIIINRWWLPKAKGIRMESVPEHCAEMNTEGLIRDEDFI